MGLGSDENSKWGGDDIRAQPSQGDLPLHFTLDDSLRSHKINNCWHEINNCYTVLGDNGKGGLSRHVQYKHKYSHCEYFPSVVSMAHADRL